MSATDTLDATVESLCGDLSNIHAPRGARLNARSWSTEAPLRMLLNNLDPDVAERPEELVVYGGSGKAARNHESLRAIVKSLLQLGHLKKIDKEGAKAWLQGKLLVACLIETLILTAERFSPWGYPRDERGISASALSLA